MHGAIDFYLFPLIIFVFQVKEVAKTNGTRSLVNSLQVKGLTRSLCVMTRNGTLTAERHAINVNNKNKK